MAENIEPNALDIAQRILDTVPRSMRAVREQIRSAAGDDFTTPQYRVLSKVSREESTVRDLAEWMGVSAPTISRMIEALVRRGLVSRKTPERGADRREVRLGATPEGAARVRKARAAVQRTLAKGIQGLSEARRRELYAGLGALQELFP